MIKVYYTTLSLSSSMRLEQVRMQKAEQVFLQAMQGKNEAVQMLVGEIRLCDRSVHNRVHLVRMTIAL